MRLAEALNLLADRLNKDPSEMEAYANEDNIGGRDGGDWTPMSIFADEGKLLYAVVRAIQPWCVLEVGVDDGCSTTHILSALEANKYGYLMSIDTKSEVGSRIPYYLKKRWTLRIGDARTTVLPTNAEIVFEDGAHEYEVAQPVIKRLFDLKPTLLLSHDAFSDEVYNHGGFQVRQAFLAATGSDKTIKLDGAFPGFSYIIQGVE